MMERTVPWWRRALQFALDGIVGLFRRNGNGEAGRETARPAVAPVAAVAQRHEEQDREIEKLQEENRVKSSFPHSEPVAAIEMVAPKFEPAPETVAVRTEPVAEMAAPLAEESVPELPAARKELSASAEAFLAATVIVPDIPVAVTPPPVQQVVEEVLPGESEAITAETSRDASVVAPDQAKDQAPDQDQVLAQTLDTEPARIEESTLEAEPPETIHANEPSEMMAIMAEAAPRGAVVPEAAEACDALNEHGRGTYPMDEPRAEDAAADSEALVPDARTPSVEPEIPSASEAAEEPAAATPVLGSETAEIAETASAEEVSEPIEIVAQAELEETTVLKVQSTPEEETTPAVASCDEPELAHAAEAATVEEASERIEVAAEAAPEEAATLEPTEEHTETSASETEPSPAAEPIVAAAPPEPPSPPAPSPTPQDFAPTLPFAEKHERTTADKVAAALKAREARGEDPEQSPFNVMVNEVYDGPLDLLLDLIRKQDIDIYDIPIAKITAQFLAYVDRLRSSDMDVAGEFIYTAALLIHIKSKMLLPRAPAGPDDAEDPRRELVERLLEHERFKNAAQMLHEKQMLEAATWTNPGIREFQEDSAAEPEIAADTTDLVRVFNEILERARNRPIINVEEDSVTVGQMIQFLARRLTMEDRPVALRRLLSHTNSERALIAMFLALLELVRLQAILLRQDRQFSEIFIKKHTGFEALMNQGLANARDDWR